MQGHNLMQAIARVNEYTKTKKVVWLLIIWALPHR